MRLAYQRAQRAAPDELLYACDSDMDFLLFFFMEGGYWRGYQHLNFFVGSLDPRGHNNHNWCYGANMCWITAYYER